MGVTVMIPDTNWNEIADGWEPFDILIGEQASVDYNPNTLRRYKGNPLAEALPPILSEVGFFKLSANYPDYSNDDRNASRENR